MSSVDVDLMNPLDETAADTDSLTPAPAPLAMPARELRTVGGLMISAMSGFGAFAPAALPQRAAAPAVDNASRRR